LTEPPISGLGLWTGGDDQQAGDWSGVLGARRGANQAEHRQLRGLKGGAHVSGGMRVAQLLAEHDVGAFVSLGREREEAAGLEHARGRAAQRFEIRKVDERVRRDDQVGARLLARERLDQIADAQIGIDVLAARLLDHGPR
jgi:hypothetical protein